MSRSTRFTFRPPIKALRFSMKDKGRSTPHLGVLFETAKIKAVALIVDFFVKVLTLNPWLSVGETKQFYRLQGLVVYKLKLQKPLIFITDPELTVELTF